MQKEVLVYRDENLEIVKFPDTIFNNQILGIYIIYIRKQHKKNT